MMRSPQAIRQTVLIAAISCSLMFVGLVGCNRDRAAETQNGKVSKTDDESSLTRFQRQARASGEELAKRGRELGGATVAKGQQAARWADTQVRQIGGAMLLKGKELQEWSLNEIYAYGNTIVATADHNLDIAGERINQLLDDMAQDPNAKISDGEKINRMVILMVPIAGPTKRYADARRMYSAGIRNDDQVMAQQARRECLIACAEMGLDIGMLGIVGGNVDIAATNADRILAALKASRSLTVIVDDDLQPFNRLLDELLEVEAICGAVDQALAFDFAGHESP